MHMNRFKDLRFFIKVFGGDFALSDFLFICYGLNNIFCLMFVNIWRICLFILERNDMRSDCLQSLIY